MVLICTVRLNLLSYLKSQLLILIFAVLIFLADNTSVLLELQPHLDVAKFDRLLVRLTMSNLVSLSFHLCFLFLLASCFYPTVHGFSSTYDVSPTLSSVIPFLQFTNYQSSSEPSMICGFRFLDFCIAAG